MNITTEQTSWRDLIAELTAEQITELEYCEREQIPPGLTTEQNRINAAVLMIRRNHVQAVCADIPIPRDCIGEPSEWMEWDDGIYQRGYTNWQEQRDGITVEILSNQYSDGRAVERTIWLTIDLIDTNGSPCDEMNTDQARTCAALLAAAADELDRLAGDAPPF